MPIHCAVEIPVLTPELFKDQDYRVMGLAFASQNELGRLCDEGVYETDLAARLRADGFRDVYTQEPVTVTHGDFSKPYFLDLLADGSLYELKSVSALTGEHQAQLLHYMLLLGLRCGKLLNFGPDSVDGKLVVTRLTPEIRRQFAVDDTRWQEISAACGDLRSIMTDLPADWGAFLEVPLYQEALTHFLGGEEQVVQRVPLARAGLPLGTQRMHVHAPGVAFVVTAYTTGLPSHEINLRKLLALTPLTALQWVNLDHANIQFVTLTR
jgi:GxxExxY protein